MLVGLILCLSADSQRPVGMWPCGLQDQRGTKGTRSPGGWFCLALQKFSNNQHQPSRERSSHEESSHCWRRARRDRGAPVRIAERFCQEHLPPGVLESTLLLRESLSVPRGRGLWLAPEDWHSLRSPYHLEYVSCLSPALKSIHQNVCLPNKLPLLSNN